MITKETAEMLGLTPLETTALECIISGLYAEPGFSDYGLSDLHQDMAVPVSTAKGVLGSLCKKGFVYVDDQFKDIIYLHSKYYALHPSQDWKDAGISFGYK